MEEFEKRLAEAEYGKECFAKLFENIKLAKGNSIVLVLSEDEEILNLGAKYLPDFAKENKSNVYVIANPDKGNLFGGRGAKLIECPDKKELEASARYLSVFGKNGEASKVVIYLTEKNTYGSNIEELLSNGSVDKENYVKYGVYSLEVTPFDKQADK